MSASSTKPPPALARPVAVTFDERLWPVIAALVALAAIGAAGIVSLGDFHDPRPWANAWTALGSLAAVTLLLIWGVSRLDRRQRGLQLAAILSLLVHLGLLAALNQQHLVAAAEARALDRPPPRPVEEFRAPDFHIRAPEDPLQAHELPVPIELPAEQPLEPERSDPQRLAEPQPDNVPAPPAEATEVEPHVLPLRQPEESTPRSAELDAQLARAEPRAVDLPEPQSVPAPAAPPVAEAPAPAPADTIPQRRELPAAVAAPAPQPDVAPSPALEFAAQAPQRRELAPEPAEPPLATAAVAGRAPRGPQLAAPQVADVPRAQSGVDQLLEAPQPLVKVPERSGAGERLPREAGTIRDVVANRVAVTPADANSAAGSPALPPRRLTDTTGAQPLAPAPNAAMGALKKATALPPASAAIGAAAAPADTAGENSAARDRAASTSAAAAPLAPSGAAGVQKSTGRLPVRVAAPEGLGGISTTPSPQVGMPSRRAREDSRVAHATARLPSRAAGGPPTIDGRTREPAAAFARRAPARQNRDGALDQPSAQTEAAIELGLVFLAKHQAADGSWSMHFAPPGADNPDPACSFRAQTAATGLALLAFLGAGYDHYGGQYADLVERALGHLVAHQQANGDLYRPEDEQANRSAHLYSHGIAAIALCEAYGMTGDRALAGPAQKAIDFIVASQDRGRGGWRYIPGNGSDTSVSGWQLMALKSGELAGLQVPPAAYERVKRWLDRAQAASSQYVYNPQAFDTPAQRHGRLPSPSMTAVGLLMRLYTGLNRQNEHMVAGAEHLLSRLPDNGTAREPARDTYYWYYATQVMFHMRGKYWRAWNGRLHPLLVSEQITEGPLAGSWDPRLPVADRWGPHAGRLYVTALNLLSLEVYYRHLPLYESTAQ